ncbi:MAG: hypothetical protein IEMM0002_1246 [bacterium]|nr:MAG: hypothetical protein IEMM0002_1246 [bacterium]
MVLNANAAHAGPEMDMEKYGSWLEERDEAGKTIKKSCFVTISREYGCDGYPLANNLRELLNNRQKSAWLVFSHPIMEKMIEDENLGAPLILSISEQRYSFVNWFIDGIVPDYLQSPQSKAFERMKTLILNLAGKGNCIILGGGASIITREIDSSKFCGVHIRLISSHENRVKRIMKRFRLDRGEAEKQVEKKQYARAKFVESFTGRTAADPTLYHLIINNDLNGPDTMSETIFSYMKLKGMI